LKQFDVIIAGGGMVGCALACGLAQANFRVALVEYSAQTPAVEDDEIDLRVSAITRASENFLRHLGAWDLMQKQRVSAYEKMHVWDAQGAGKIKFDAADIAEPNLGHIIENRVTLSALWQCVDAEENIVVFRPNHVKSYDKFENILTLNDEQELQAPLVVGAEGAKSPLREMAKITTSGWKYQQTALVCTIETEHYHSNTTYQRFMPNGPLAFLPINDGRCSIVWSTTDVFVDELLNMSDEDFCQALTVHSEGILGQVTGCSAKASFPLELKNADAYVKPGLALVGDAAHSVHPLAGQGVNLGFMDAAELIDVLVAGREQSMGLGGLSLLRRYERVRRSEDMIMLGTMDLFNRLFSNQHRPLAFIRNIGLELANHALPLKQQIMWQALGMSEQMPSLAQPLK